MPLSQVIFLFCAYSGLASTKHVKLKLSLPKFFPYFPDVWEIPDFADVGIVFEPSHHGIPTNQLSYEETSSSAA